MYMALKDVLLDELRDMYSAENQLVKALPKLAKGANSPKLKALITAHLAETKGQVERLKKVFSLLDKKATGQHCNGMEGVIEEGKDALEKDEEGASFDCGIVGAALRTEHYEIAGYEACISMATVLKLPKVVRLLNANLREELSAAKKVSAAGLTIMKQSAKEPEAPKKPKTSKEEASEKESEQDEAEAAPEL
jgi:ferritin-like metal-binding protein YciE